MTRPKTPPLTFAEWWLKETLPVSGTAHRREQALNEAVHELAKFAGWSDQILEGVKADPKFTGHLANIASILRRELGRQEKSRPSHTANQVRRISAALNDAYVGLSDSHAAAENVMFYYDAKNANLMEEFVHAIVALGRLATAADKAANAKEPVWRTFLGQKSSNIANLIFLEHCRDCMSTFGRGQVSLWKTHGALLRFARPLYTYATGLEVADGAFDRQLDELRRIPPTARSESRPKKRRRSTRAQSDSAGILPAHTHLSGEKRRA
jgi:hypothetical protein